MNKIGISTLHSYRAAQIFEILGLNKILLLNIFHTPSRIEGIGLMEVEKKLKKDIKSISKLKVASLLSLEIGGIYRWRRTAKNICLTLLLLLNYNKQYV
jgi:glutamate synthase (ferredoxin)